MAVRPALADNAPALALLAEESDRLVGYSQLRPSAANASVRAERPAELRRIYVSREWLGVWEHNPKAIAFYRKFAFEIVGQKSFMLGNESQLDIVMAVRMG